MHDRQTVWPTDYNQGAIVCSLPE